MGACLCHWTIRAFYKLRQRPYLDGLPMLHKVSWDRAFIYFISVFILPNLWQLHWSPSGL